MRVRCDRRAAAAHICAKMKPHSRFWRALLRDARDGARRRLRAPPARTVQVSAPKGFTGLASAADRWLDCGRMPPTDCGLPINRTPLTIFRRRRALICHGIDARRPQRAAMLLKSARAGQLLNYGARIARDD